MNSISSRCHDNARCESMWARMKEELFYSRNDKSENYTIAQLKTRIWRYYALLSVVCLLLLREAFTISMYPWLPEIVSPNCDK